MYQDFCRGFLGVNEDRKTYQIEDNEILYYVAKKKISIRRKSLCVAGPFPLETERKWELSLENERSNSLTGISKLDQALFIV